MLTLFEIFFLICAFKALNASIVFDDSVQIAPKVVSPDGVRSPSVAKDLLDFRSHSSLYGVDCEAVCEKVSLFTILLVGRYNNISNEPFQIGITHFLWLFT